MFLLADKLIGARVGTLLVALACVASCASGALPSVPYTSTLSAASFDASSSFHPDVKQVHWLIANDICFSSGVGAVPGCDITELFRSVRLQKLQCEPNDGRQSRIGMEATCAFEVVHEVGDGQWDLYCQDAMRLEYTTWWDDIAQYYGWKLKSPLTSPRRVEKDTQCL